MLGEIEPPLVHRDRAERPEARAHPVAADVGKSAPDRDGAPRELLGGVEAAERAIDARDGLEEIRLDVRLRGELGRETAAGLVEEIRADTEPLRTVPDRRSRRGRSGIP